MGNEINIQQKIQEFKKVYPKYESYSDIQIVSIMQQQGVIKFTYEQQHSLFSNAQSGINTDNVSFGNIKQASKVKTIKR